MTGYGRYGQAERTVCVDQFDWMSRRQCNPGFAELPVIEQRAICQGCPVRGECIDLALDTEGAAFAYVNNTWPVYGGLSGAERKALLGAERKALK